MAIDLLQSATIYELVTELRGKSKRLTPIFGALKKESHSLVEQRVLKLIDKGLAYVDESTPDQIREMRGTLTEAGINSPYRDRPIEETKDLFARMTAGETTDEIVMDMLTIRLNKNLNNPII